MTLRYKLFKRPGNLDEVTDLLKSKQAKRIEMQLVELTTDERGDPLNEFRCDYRVQTSEKEFLFQYTFPDKSKLSELVFQNISRAPTRQSVSQQLSQQKEEFTKSGIECSFYIK